MNIANVYWKFRPLFNMGANTLTVSMTLHATNRRRLCDKLAQADSQLAAKPGTFVVLEGGKSTNRYCTDTENLFRQESYFHWAFGVLEPECYGAIQVSTGKSVIFMPRLPDSYAVWMGELQTCEDFRLKYAVDEVYYTDEVSLFASVSLGGQTGGAAYRTFLCRLLKC